MPRLSVARRYARFALGLGLDQVPPPVAAKATSLALDYPRQFVGHVVVRLRDGRLLEARQDHPRCGPDFPLTREEVEAKFLGNAARAVPAEQSARVVKIVGALAAQEHITALTDSLTA